MPAEREGTPVSAAKTTPVSSEGVCVRVLFESVLWKSLFLSDEQCDIFILMINSLFQETVE